MKIELKDGLNKIIMNIYDYLIHLVKTYFSTVFFVLVLGNILLRFLVINKKKKKKNGGGIEIIWISIYNFFCFYWIFFLLRCLFTLEGGTRIVRVGYDQLESL